MLYYTTPPYSLQCSTPHYIALFYPTLRDTTIHNTKHSLRYTTLHYTTLHYTTLYYSTLLYITLHVLSYSFVSNLQLPTHISTYPFKRVLLRVSLTYNILNVCEACVIWSDTLGIRIQSMTTLVLFSKHVVVPDLIAENASSMLTYLHTKGMPVVMHTDSLVCIHLLRAITRLFILSQMTRSNDQA